MSPLVRSRMLLSVVKRKFPILSEGIVYAFICVESGDSADVMEGQVSNPV